MSAQVAGDENAAAGQVNALHAQPAAPLGQPDARPNAQPDAQLNAQPSVPPLAHAQPNAQLNAQPNAQPNPPLNAAPAAVADGAGGPAVAGAGAGRHPARAAGDQRAAALAAARSLLVAKVPAAGNRCSKRVSVECKGHHRTGINRACVHAACAPCCRIWNLDVACTILAHQPDGDDAPGVVHEDGAEDVKVGGGGKDADGKDGKHGKDQHPRDAPPAAANQPPAAPRLPLGAHPPLAAPNAPLAPPAAAAPVAEQIAYLVAQSRLADERSRAADERIRVLSSVVDRLQLQGHGDQLRAAVAAVPVWAKDGEPDLGDQLQAGLARWSVPAAGQPQVPPALPPAVPPALAGPALPPASGPAPPASGSAHVAPALVPPVPPPPAAGKSAEGKGKVNAPKVLAVVGVVQSALERVSDFSAAIKGSEVALRAKGMWPEAKLTAGVIDAMRPTVEQKMGAAGAYADKHMAQMVSRLQMMVEEAHGKSAAGLVLEDDTGLASAEALRRAAKEQAEVVKTSLVIAGLPYGPVHAGPAYHSPPPAWYGQQQQQQQQPLHTPAPPLLPWPQQQLFPLHQTPPYQPFPYQPPLQQTLPYQHQPQQPQPYAHQQLLPPQVYQPPQAYQPQPPWRKRPAGRGAGGAAAGGAGQSMAGVSGAGKQSHAHAVPVVVLPQQPTASTAPPGGAKRP
jgi:hypothetical protein